MSNYVFSKGYGYGYSDDPFTFSMLASGQVVVIESKIESLVTQVGEVLSHDKLWKSVEDQFKSYALQFATGNIYCVNRSTFFSNLVSSELQQSLSSLEAEIGYSFVDNVSVFVLFPIPSGGYGCFEFGGNLLLCNREELSDPVRTGLPTVTCQNNYIEILRNCDLMSKGLFEIFNGDASHPLVYAFNRSLHIFEPQAFANVLNRFLPNGYFWLALGVDDAGYERVIPSLQWSVRELGQQVEKPGTNGFDTDCHQLMPVALFKSLADSLSSSDSSLSRPCVVSPPSVGIPKMQSNHQFRNSGDGGTIRFRFDAALASSSQVVEPCRSCGESNPGTRLINMNDVKLKT